ncbi:fimbrial chaperone protein, partial [Salmonella enterica subsp. enterica]|nr:fimbrial chaperone protein [Salmonella enterica subsp. enterica serovar 4,12:d:-]EDD3065478.1 fimbrial chaperone protein [Salmonella enterica subsp. enterica serovar Kentucky]EDD4017704.1 fimbrial chaperone protein [Salmonella enterica subsp. enterica serovar Kentucky]EDS7250209.1 fimbrial chaperone protein [Salmonella enterica subsp. enterica]
MGRQIKIKGLILMPAVTKLPLLLLS